jgi:hypothetical protein
MTMLLAGTSGLLTTVLGIALVFFPAQQISSILWYEVWMIGGTLFFIGLAAFFFFVYGRHKVLQPAGVATISVGRGDSPVPASEAGRGV